MPQLFRGFGAQATNQTSNTFWRRRHGYILELGIFSLLGQGVNQPLAALPNKKAAAPEGPPPVKLTLLA
jgi:hypothetical protein